MFEKKEKIKYDTDGLGTKISRDIFLYLIEKSYDCVRQVKIINVVY